MKLDVSLHRAEQVHVTVLTPSGQAAAGADVGLVSPGAQLRLCPGGFSRQMGASPQSLLRADDAGRFQLTVDKTITRVVVACVSGFAETTPVALEESPTINLQRWGRIEGICRSEGQPTAGHEYLLALSNSNEGDYNTLKTDFTAYQAKSDAQGRFTIPMAPPGKHALVRLYPQRLGPHRTNWMYGDRTEVDIQPGKTTTVTFGNKGYTVTANLQWPGSVALTNAQISALLYTSRPPLPAGLKGHPTLIQKYYHSPQFQALAKTFHTYPMVLQPDGTLGADDVPPGDYYVSVSVIVTPFQPNHNSTSGLASGPGISVTVPSDFRTGQLNIGTIKLHQTELRQVRPH